MLSLLRRTAVVFGASSAVAIACIAGPASAATQQSGLVNIAVTSTTIQVPVAVAANICNVTANVIASNNFTPNGGPCTSTSTPSASGGGGGGGGNTSQQGLVNVAVTNTTIQVPIGIAANICNVTANVIASGNFTPNGGACTAVSRPSAA